jgi:hypothetical protein
LTNYGFSSTSSGSWLTSGFDIRCTEHLGVIAINLVTLTVMKFMELAADHDSYQVSVLVVICVLLLPDLHSYCDCL